MSLSTPFIHRPIATTLLTLGLALVGAVSYFLLPVAPLPQVDYPTISVSASLPGASPDTMAATVATPLERSLGAIAAPFFHGRQAGRSGKQTLVLLAQQVLLHLAHGVAR